MCLGLEIDDGILFHFQFTYRNLLMLKGIDDVKRLSYRPNFVDRRLLKVLNRVPFKPIMHFYLEKSSIRQNQKKWSMIRFNDIK
jgi:hypothetical protein